MRRDWDVCGSPRRTCAWRSQRWRRTGERGGADSGQACSGGVTGADVTVEECTSFGPQAAVSTFTDAKGWYPGIEIRGASLFYRDSDASP